ncbi:MAG: type 4a pilus biogenesis protein PilO [Candidatus Omnitrophica bacterium]|nr:type 4a pilus biogenesis protein PilO [Candidatus Omnitrophota bacterium]
MDLNSLKNVSMDDLKNIDPAMVKEYLRRRPDILINVAIIVVGLFFCLNSSSGPKQEIQGTRSLITEGEKKKDLLDKLKVIEKKRDDIKKNFHKIGNTDLLTSLVSGLALKNGIDITTFSPWQKNDSTYYYTDSMQLELTAARYKNLGEFIKALEKTEYTVLVDRMSCTPVNYDQGRDSKGAEPYIRATVSLRTITLHNE